MAKVTGGEAIVRSLIAQGVDTIFGLPGVQSDHLFNALYDHRDKIRVVHSRHEQGAAYMAFGWALAQVLHFAFHIDHLEGFSTTDSIAQTIGLAAFVVLALIPVAALKPK